MKDICFLHGCERPTLALLYQDNRGNQNVRTREVCVVVPTSSSSSSSSSFSSSSSCYYILLLLLFTILFFYSFLPFQIVIEEKELVDGPWKQPNVEAGASALLPVPLPLGGVLVVGEETVSYLNGSSSFGKVYFYSLFSVSIFFLGTPNLLSGLMSDFT